MNVTSTVQSQYTTSSTNTRKTNQEGINPTKGQDYVLKTLDDEGNELLNQILEGKTDQEKWMLKLSLDMGLSTKVENGTVVNVTDIDNSKNSSIDRVDAFIQERKRLNAPDMQGTAAIAEKLLEAYKSNSTFVDIQYREGSVVDDFLNDLYSKETIEFKSSIIKDEIENKVNEYASLMMEEKGDASMSELQTAKLLNQYKNELLQEYRDSLENSNNINAEKQAIIKVLLDENVKETSSLKKLLATTSGTNANQETKAIGKMAEMQEKYKDAFMSMPGSFSQEREDLQTKIIRERYPDYLPMDDALEKYGVKADRNNPETPEAKAIREEANRQFIEDHGGQEAWDERTAFIRGVFRQYPNNLIDKWHDIPNAKERANVFNAGVYEGLEKGKNLQKAVGNATHVVTMYLDNSELWTQRLQGSNDFFVGDDKTFVAEGIDKHNNETINYDDGHKLDLRKYGFDRDLSTRIIYDNESQMVTSIQNQLDYANFLIDNFEIVQQAFDQMDEEWTKDMNIYQDFINPAKELIEPAELALSIFSQYKIFA